MTAVASLPKNACRASLPDLPSELQLQIFGYLAEEHTGTLASLAATCRGIKDAAMEVLYNNIIVNGRNLAFGKSEGVDLYEVSLHLPRVSRVFKISKNILHSCKSLQLLEFPRYVSFYEDAFNHEFCAEVTRSASIKSEYVSVLLAPGNSDVTDRSKAIARKTVFLAAVTGVRTLCIDIVEPQLHEYFSHLAHTLMRRDYLSTKVKELQAGDYSNISCTTRWQPRDPNKRDVPSDIDKLFMKHFASLTTIEIRTVSTILQARNPDVELSHGTIVINGTWPYLPSLRTFKFHGHSINGEMVELFFSTVIPTSMVLNGFHCSERRHPPFSTLLATTRDDFENKLTSFEWKNIEPCNRAQSQVAQLLHTQLDSLESVSIVRKRLNEDRDRHTEQFSRGYLSFRSFSKLEYLDIDSRFLIRTEEVDKTGLALGVWLNIPSCLRILSIDAVTEKETIFVQRYLYSLADGIEAGMFTRLKEVRVGCMGFKGERVKPWMVLENLPVKYLTSEVRLVVWEYDAGEK